MILRDMPTHVIDVSTLIDVDSSDALLTLCPIVPCVRKPSVHSFSFGFRKSIYGVDQVVRQKAVMDQNTVSKEIMVVLNF